MGLFENLDGQGFNPVEQMMAVWNRVGIRTFYQTPLQETPNITYHSLHTYYRDQEMGIYFSDNWFADAPPNALATTICDAVVLHRNERQYCLARTAPNYSLRHHF